MEKLNELPKRVNSLEEDMAGLADDVDNWKAEGQMMNNRIVALEQYSRKNNVLISGIPILQNENVREIVRSMADSMGIPVQEHDLDIVHRLPERNGSSVIIAKLNSRELKNAIIRSAKRTKLNSSFLKLQQEGENTPVYCEEHLVAENKKILMKAKQLKKQGSLKHVWVRDCAVRIRVTDVSRAIVVTSEEQLNEVVQSKEDLSDANNRTLKDSQPEARKSQKKRNIEDRSPKDNSVKPANRYSGGDRDRASKQLKLNFSSMRQRYNSFNSQKQLSQNQTPQ